MSVALIVAVALAATLGIVALPAMPSAFVLGAILLIRSLSDVGASTGGSLLPSSAISGALGVVAIIAALVPSGRRPGVYALVISVCAVFFVTLWTLVGVVRYEFSSAMLSESVRLVSLVAIGLLAARVAGETGTRGLRVLVMASFPSALVLCIGFLARVPVTISFSGRAVGTFSHANSAAAFMGVLGLLLLSLYLKNRRPATFFLTLVTVGALLLTQSLGGLAAFAAGAAILVILSTSMSTARKLLLMIGAIGAATVAFSVSGASQRLSEFQAFNAETAIATGVSDDSLGWRFINWNLLLRAWGEHPLMGYGLGSTQTFVMPLGAPPHSAFVQILVETGLVGAAIVGLAFIVLLRRLRAAVVHRSWSALTATAVLGMLVVNGSESNLLGYTATSYVAVALVTMLLVAEKRSGAGEAEFRPTVALLQPVRKRGVPIHGR
jgi:O-antigen ligase